VRRERRQDVLHGAVLVDIAGNTERREFAHLVRRGDRAAEDQDGQPSAVKLPDGADEIDAARMRQPQIEDDQVQPIEIRPDARQQLRGALDGQRLVSRAEERRREPVAHERGVVGDDDSLGARHGGRRHAPVIGRADRSR
jgi:hypothetical protein